MQVRERIAKKVEARRKKKTAVLDLFVVNADNNRADDVLRRELLGAWSMGLDVLVAIETVGYNRMPDLPGSVRFSSRITKGRQNVTVWVAEKWADVLSSEDWIRHDHGWPETKGSGIHWPRETMTFSLGRIPFTAGHAPPGSPGTDKARDEFVDIWTRRLAPWKRPNWEGRRKGAKKALRALPTIALLDTNGLGGTIAQATSMRQIGDKVERILIRNARCISARYTTDFGGVRFTGDHAKHGGGLHARVEVPAWYLKRRPMAWLAAGRDS